MGGSRTETKARHLINLILTFTLCGFWHGANWTFISWGFLNAIYYLPLVIRRRHKRFTDTVAQGHFFPTSREMLQIAGTFSMTLFAWIFFRVNSMSHAYGFIKQLFIGNWLKTPSIEEGLPYVLIVLVVEWFQRDKQHALQIDKIPVWGRWATYYAVLLSMFLYSKTGHVPFIYFQF